MVVEEELVCAMGRLLLVGSRPRDWDDVLSLVEQTMDIPRLVPRLGSAARQEAGIPRLRAPYTPAEYKFDDDHLGPNKPPARGDEFLAVTSHGVGFRSSNSLTFATPGNNTLSILLEACQKVVAMKAAEEYWNMLTDPITYNITPDVKNLDQRLRLLRQHRASAAAVRTLKEDFLARGNVPRAGTFRIAMSTCVRDKNNHNSLRHANEILHLMSTTLPDVDAKAVSMYAELALTFPLAKGEDLVEALTYLHPITRNLRLQLGVGGERVHSKNIGAVYLTGDNRKDAIGALQKIYAVYDRLLLSNLIAEERKALFKPERARLSAFIQRIVYKSAGGGKKWEMAKEESGSDETTGEPSGEMQEEAPTRGVNERRAGSETGNYERSAGSERGGSDRRGGGQRGGYDRKAGYERSDRGRGEQVRERRPGGWKAKNVRPEEERRPWFSSLGASDSA